jgi:hypothetical protein
VVKRTQGGSDFDRDWLIALYRECHAQMDAAFYQGRLILTILGDSRYHCEVVHGGEQMERPAGWPRGCGFAS